MSEIQIIEWAEVLFWCVTGTITMLGIGCAVGSMIRHGGRDRE